MRFLIREVENMRRTKPVIGMDLQTIPSLDEGEAVDLQARVSAYAASEPVKAAVDQLIQIPRRFPFAAMALNDMQEREIVGPIRADDSPAPLYPHVRVGARSDLQSSGRGFDSHTRLADAGSAVLRFDAAEVVDRFVSHLTDVGDARSVVGHDPPPFEGDDQLR